MKVCKHCQEEIKSGAKRCPHCQGNLRSFVTRHPILAIFLFIIGLALVVNIFINPAKRIEEAKQAASPTPLTTPVPDDKKLDLANTYCDNHKETYRLPDYTSDGMPPLQTKDGYSRQVNGSKGLTIDDCKQVIDVLINKMGESYQTLQDIADRKYWTGMRPYQAALSIGVPDNINNTANASSVRQQWVYSYVGSSTYLYFDGKDKDGLTLTSWQN
jgi:hypothetical protein